MSIESERGFVVDAEEVAEEIKRVAFESISEEDLRQGVEYVLRSMVLEKLQYHGVLGDRRGLGMK